jgi:hypothetical protein
VLFGALPHLQLQLLSMQEFRAAFPDSLLLIVLPEPGSDSE